MSNRRNSILSLLRGERLSSVPTFSGLIHVTAAGLEHEGLAFHEIHRDADKMARAAASTFRGSGFPSAAVPLNLCVEAEALGAEVDFRESESYEFPRVVKPLFETGVQCLQTLEQWKQSPKSGDFGVRGRIPLVCKSIAQLKHNIGEEVVIGGIIPGPFTLLLLLVEPGALFTEMKRSPEIILEALSHLSSFLAQVGGAYRGAGADFLTIHDMGGSPSLIGPVRFEEFVLPAQQRLIAELPKPRILSVCGKTDGVMHLLAQSGAEAISVDQTNNLAASRAALSDTLLFGNLDPVETLSRGTRYQVRAEVDKARAAGIDALWPGCDLYPPTPLENLKAMLTG